MADLSHDDVLQLAHLARIGLSEAEVAEYAHELGEVLTYVEQLQSVDVSDVEPTDQVTGLTNVMRADEPRDYGYTSDDLLKHSLHVEDRQLKVKRMLQA